MFPWNYITGNEKVDISFPFGSEYAPFSAIRERFTSAISSHLALALTLCKKEKRPEFPGTW